MQNTWILCTECERLYDTRDKFNLHNKTYHSEPDLFPTPPKEPNISRGQSNGQINEGAHEERSDFEDANDEVEEDAPSEPEVHMLEDLWGETVQIIVPTIKTEPLESPPITPKCKSSPEEEDPVLFDLRSQYLDKVEVEVDNVEQSEEFQSQGQLKSIEQGQTKEPIIPKDDNQTSKYGLRKNPKPNTCFCGGEDCSEMDSHETELSETSDTESELKVPKKKREFDRVKCKVCDKICSAKGLHSHHRLSHPGQPFRCTLCSREFFAESALKRHFEAVHVKKTTPYICSICNRMFRKSENLQIHKQIHVGQKSYECQFCKFNFLKLTTYMIHMKNYHPEGINMND